MYQIMASFQTPLPSLFNKLCGGVSQLKLPPCPVIQVSVERKRFSTVLATCFLVLSLFILVPVSAFYYSRKSRKSTSSAIVSTDGYWRLKFTYEEIHKATDGFSEANLVGSGSYGSVYKGNIGAELTTVAIKVLKLQCLNSYKTFTAECEALRMVRHRNIAKILTSCSSTDYEGNYFLALSSQIHALWKFEWVAVSEKIEHFWKAKYCHWRGFCSSLSASPLPKSSCSCDLKPSNILLDDGMRARISDFGLARILTSGTYETSLLIVKGTVGYAPPGT